MYLFLQRIYKSAYEAEKHKNKPLADSNEMQLARKLVADTHDKYYKAAAQADFADAKIDTGMHFNFNTIFSLYFHVILL